MLLASCAERDPSFLITVPTLQVSAGYLHTCAFLEARTSSYPMPMPRLVCWGNNYFHQVGSPDEKLSYPAMREVPLPEGRLRPVAVIASRQHTCGIFSAAENRVYCWGNNEDGRLGIGNSFVCGNCYTPQAVLEPPNYAVAIDYTAAIATHALSDHTCIRRIDGQVYCWGRDEFGQLGIGTTQNSSSPVKLTSLGRGVTQLSVGQGHSCAWADDGQRPYCWGAGRDGQLGDNSCVDILLRNPVQGF